MLSDDIVGMLNKQVDAELYASQLYLQMAAWCQVKGLAGSARFFQGHATEETSHRDRIVEYLFECDAPVRLGTVEAPPAEFGSLLDVIRKAYEHEQLVTASINAIASAALAAQDFSTFSFVQWFINEQREEESLFRGVLDHASLLAFKGESGEAMWHLNNYLEGLAE